MVVLVLPFDKSWIRPCIKPYRPLFFFSLPLPFLKYMGLRWIPCTSSYHSSARQVLPQALHSSLQLGKDLFQDRKKQTSLRISPLLAKKDPKSSPTFAPMYSPCTYVARGWPQRWRTATVARDTPQNLLPVQVLHCLICCHRWWAAFPGKIILTSGMICLIYLTCSIIIKK